MPANPGAQVMLYKSDKQPEPGTVEVHTGMKKIEARSYESIKKEAGDKGIDVIELLSDEDTYRSYRAGQVAGLNAFDAPTGRPTAESSGDPSFAEVANRTVSARAGHLQLIGFGGIGKSIPELRAWIWANTEEGRNLYGVSRDIRYQHKPYSQVSKLIAKSDDRRLPEAVNTIESWLHVK